MGLPRLCESRTSEWGLSLMSSASEGRNELSGDGRLSGAGTSNQSRFERAANSKIGNGIELSKGFRGSRIECNLTYSKTINFLLKNLQSITRV